MLMALIKCPECGAQISDRADACIYCGYPIKQCILNESGADRSSGSQADNEKEVENEKNSVIDTMKSDDTVDVNSKLRKRLFSKKTFGKITVSLLFIIALVTCFISINKLNKKSIEKGSNVLTTSDKGWQEPVLTSYHEFDDLVISVPTNWRKRDLLDEQSLHFYYYPYDNNEKGFVMIYDQNSTLTDYSSEKSEYDKYVNGCKKDSSYNNIEDYDIEINEKTIRFLRSDYLLNDNIYEMHQYIFCYKKRLHVYAFFEIGKLSNEMTSLADKMINSLHIKDEESIDSSTSTDSGKKDSSKLDSEKQNENTNLSEFASNYIACVAKSTFKNPYSVMLHHVYVMAVDIEDKTLYSITVSLTAENGMGGMISKTFSGNIVLENEAVESVGFYGAINDVMKPDSESFLSEIYWTENEKYCEEESTYELNATEVQILYNGIL